MNFNRRAYSEYLLWLAFTAVPWVPTTPRYRAARNYFRAIGVGVWS